MSKYNWHSPDDGSGLYWFYICHTIFCVMMVGGLWIGGSVLWVKLLHNHLILSVIFFTAWSALMLAWMGLATTKINNPDGTAEWRGYFR